MTGDIHRAAVDRMSQAIANSKGVPGTLGCFVLRPGDPHPYFLTNAHVLLGKNARVGEHVWSLGKAADGSYQFLSLGTTADAKLGSFGCEGVLHFVDCAIGRMQHADLKKIVQPIPIQGTAVAQIGEPVVKIGAASGLTTGIVTDVCYPDTICIERKNYEAANQILIAPVSGGQFSHPGDSGAVVLNGKHQVVGLLWGSNGKGEGIATHIAPVLSALGITIIPDPRVRARSIRRKLHEYLEKIIPRS